jgi:hypothetical protein
MMNRRDGHGRVKASERLRERAIATVSLPDIGYCDE